MSSQRAKPVPALNDAVRYEYSTAVRSSQMAFGKILNQLSDEGWEVVGYAIHAEPMPASLKKKEPISVAELMEGGTVTHAAIVRRPLMPVTAAPRKRRARQTDE